MPAGAKRVVWSPKAKQDLRNIWRYFARVASPETADKLLHEIAQAGARAGERPLLGRSREEVMPRLRSVLVRPYTVFYRVSDASVEIVRVLHERRNFSTAFNTNER